MSNPELDRIRQDLARAKERVAQIERGERGVRTGPFLDTDGSEPGAGLACSSQLKAQRDAVERLEHELVGAMIPRFWQPAAVIERMTAPIAETKLVVNAAPADNLRSELEALLQSPDKFFSRTALKELLES
jgi:hypothetical protein